MGVAPMITDLRTFTLTSFAIFATACGAPATTHETNDTEAEDNLYGDVSYSGSACTSDRRQFHDEILKYGRVASASQAFEQCVTQKINDGVYRECNKDPGKGLPKATQLELVLQVARSDNDLGIKCSGGSGNASTSLGKHNHSGVESFSWGGWFASVHGQMSKPLCSETSSSDCRYAAHPWPYSQAAGIVWHEVMHTHGYTHGANDQAGAIVACGYSGDASWHYQVNTMPYIVGQCINEVIDRSGEQCGNPDSCWGSNRLRMIDEFDGTSCSCQHDPHNDGFGTIGMNDGELEDEIVYASGDWFYGGWHYSADNDIAATGDFDGDGDDDFIITSGWGLAVARRAGTRFYAMTAKPWGSWIGGWHLGGNNTIVGVGNFDGAGGDDFIIRSGWGLAVVSLVGGQLVLRDTIPFNTWVTNWWATASDTIEAIGDFDGDGKDELILRRASSGFAMVELDSWASGDSSGAFASGHDFSAFYTTNTGRRLGGWRHGSGDVFGGVGNFNGDGKDDLLVRSGWGFAILTRSGNSWTTLTIKRFRTYLGAWYLRASDQLGPIGDFDGDGRAELLLKGFSGVAVFGTYASGYAFIQKHWRAGSWIGGWHLSRYDTLHGVGDFDGDGAEDVVIRSGWGVGVISFDYTPRLLDADAFGDLQGAWLLDDTDELAAVGDFDSDGKAELMLTTQ